MKRISALKLLILLLFITLATVGISAPPDHAGPPDDNDTGTAPPGNTGKVLLCHKDHVAINVSINAQAAHLAHGDWLIDAANPCPSSGSGGGGNSTPACVGDGAPNPVMQADIDLLGALGAAQFDPGTGLVYLPEVQVDILGFIQTFAAILERINDTDFLVRYVAAVNDPVAGVIVVGFDGTSTTAPFDVNVVPDSTGVTEITDIEFSVLQGCNPTQLTVTNFNLNPAGN